MSILVNSGRNFTNTEWINLLMSGIKKSVIAKTLSRAWFLTRYVSEGIQMMANRIRFLCQLY